MPPKHSGNAGSTANKRPQTNSSSRSSKKESLRESTRDSTRESTRDSSREFSRGKPTDHSGAARKSQGPRSDGRSANGPHGRPDTRSGPRSDPRPDSRSGSRPGSRPDSRREARAEGSALRRPQPVAEPESSEGVRLNKAIAATGHCSRRNADELILAGRVRINGQLESNPARHVLPFESIVVDGRILSAPQAFTYLMLNKPVQVVCTVSDPEGRPTVLDCLPQSYKGLRLYPVGRLDYFSEGMLLLTNDGQLAQRLTHPSHHQPKTYEVLVRGTVPEAALKTMRRGMRLAEGEDLLPVDVTAQPAAGNTMLQMVLRQGFNRQIRRMCRDLGLTVLRLCRVAQGALHLGNLASGKVRALTDEEVTKLRESAGL